MLSAVQLFINCITIPFSEKRLIAANRQLVIIHANNRRIEVHGYAEDIVVLPASGRYTMRYKSIEEKEITWSQRNSNSQRWETKINNNVVINFVHILPF
jgi:hypothetical protein